MIVLAAISRARGNVTKVTLYYSVKLGLRHGVEDPTDGITPQ